MLDHISQAANLFHGLGVTPLRVTYEDLPEHFDPMKGLKPVQEKIHPEIGIDDSNVQKHVDQEFGRPAVDLRDMFEWLESAGYVRLGKAQ